MISTSHSTRGFPSQGACEEGPCHSGLEGLIEQHPAASVLIGFGLGVGAGVLLSCTMKNPSQLLPNKESFAEQLGHRVMDSLRDLRGIVPSSWTDHFAS